MNEVPSLQSTMEQQGEIVKEVAQAVVDSVIIPWTEIKYRVRSIAPFLEDEVLTIGTDGNTVSGYAPDLTIDLVGSLRELMYTEGAGTWFSAELSINASGQLDADFNFNDEPDWQAPVSNQWYSRELAKYPRDSAAIPAWLQEKLRLAQ